MATREQVIESQRFIARYNRWSGATAVHRYTAGSERPERMIDKKVVRDITEACDFFRQCELQQRERDDELRRGA